MATPILSGDATELFGLLPAMPETSQAWALWSAPERAAERLPVQAASGYWLSEHDAYMAASSFNGGVSQADALRMVRDGWPEGAARVARLRDRIVANRPLGPRMARWDVAGAYPSVPRALSGNPLNMRRIDTTRTRRKPVVTLVNHMGGLADVDADCFTNKAAVVAAIVDVIEAAGYSVNLLGVSLAHANGHLAATVVQVKEPGAAVDIARIAFALGHVAMFRQVVFGLRFSDRANARMEGSGSTADFPKDNVAPDVFILPSMNSNADKFATEDKAATDGLAYFIGELVKQGCPAFAAA